MSKRSSVSALSAALAFTACGSADAVGESSDEIRGGEAESGMPAVGLVAFGGQYCTGTLVAPDVVLTAAHCVTDAPMTFFTTAGSPIASVPHAVARRKPYPFWVDLAQCPNPTRDIALLELAEPVADIAPIAYGGVPPRGETCTAVGFGRNGTVERRKRSGTSHIDDVTGSAVVVSWGDALAHAGDSGSPLLCNDAIVATAACHNDGDGPTHRHELYQRIDEAKDWIRLTIEAWHTPR